MDLKKVLSGLTAIAVVANSFFVGGFVANVNAQVLNDPEFDMALSWAYDNAMTKYDTVDAFRPFSNITREESSKFVDVFAMTNLCLSPDAGAECSFSDIPADPSLDEYVTLACQLGVFKGSNGMFYPTASLTKAQLIAVLVRAIRAADGLEALSESTDPWWANYFDFARSIELTKETDVWALDRPVTRYETLLLIYRAAQALDLECDTTADDILDILDDILGGGDNTDDEDDMDDEDLPTESNGTLEVSLSPTTPAGDTVPGLATIPVAEFELISTGEPVVLNSLILRRYGIGNDDAVERVSLFVDGKRLSNDKAFNSDDEAILTLNPKVEVGTSSPVKVMVVAEVGDSATASNQEFIIGIPSEDHVLSNGMVDGNFPIKANEFEVAGVNAPLLEIDHDGTLPDVELGAIGAEISDFELSSDEDDIWLTHITFTDGENTIDDAAENFELVCDGDVVASLASTSDDILPFDLEDPLLVEEGKTTDCSIFADIIAEAGETIDLFVDEKIDVMGESDYGFGIAVDITGIPEGGQSVDILAGELTLIEETLPSDEVKDNTDNVVLGAFRVVVNNGKDLFIEDIEFDFAAPTNDPNDNIGEWFEDFEIFDATNNTRYDLSDDCDTNTALCNLNEDGVDIFLPDGGEVLLQVRADTVNTFPFDPGVDDVTVRLSLDTSQPDLVIKEAADDEDVTDIVPSLLTFNSIDLVESAVVVQEIPLSDISVVRGATDVVALQFQIDTDQVSPAFLQEITIEDGGNGNFDQAHISAVRLYRGVPNGTNSLVQAEGGFDIEGGDLTFDNFNEIEIPVNSTQPMFVTIDIVDDSSLTGDVIDIEVSDTTLPDIEDEDGDDMDVTVNSNGTRDITIEDFGALSCEFDTSDNAVEDPTIVLGGTESGVLGSWEITATNEPIWIRDVTITLTGSTVGFTDAFDEVILLADDGVTELYSEFIVSPTMVLNEVSGPEGGDFIIDEGTENVYVKFVAAPTNEDEGNTEGGPYSLVLSVTEAEGVSSNEDVTASCGGASEDFWNRSVAISDVDLVEAVGNSPKLPDTLAEGVQNSLGIIMFQADTWTNENPDNSQDLDILLSGITVEIENGTDAVLSGVSIRRRGESQRTTVQNVPVGTNNVYFDMSELSAGEDNKISSSETVYFIIEGIPTDADEPSDIIRVDIVNLYGGFIEYSADFSGAAITDAIYLDQSEIDGFQISGPQT